MLSCVASAPRAAGESSLTTINDSRLRGRAAFERLAAAPTLPALCAAGPGVAPRRTYQPRHTSLAVPAVHATGGARSRRAAAAATPSASSTTNSTDALQVPTLASTGPWAGDGEISCGCVQVAAASRAAHRCRPVAA